MKNLTDLFCKYEDQDIYVITGGPSLNYIDKSFFEGKVVIGVNDIFRYFRCDYVVVKDCMEEPRFTRLTEELKEKDIPLIYSEYHKGHRSEGLNEIDNPNSYMFKHNPREEGRDFIDEISELEGDEILVVNFKEVVDDHHRFKLDSPELHNLGDPLNKSLKDRIKELNEEDDGEGDIVVRI